MNIQAAFLSSLISSPRISPGTSPEDFLGRILPPEEDSVPPSLPQLLSAGKITASSPWSFDFSPLDCYLLLYTKRGCGKLLERSQVHTLCESSLLFWDCRQRFRIDIAISPWEYQVFFLTGNILSYYYGLVSPGQVPLIKIPSGSHIAIDMELLAGLVPPLSPCQSLLVSDRLNHIAIHCAATLLSEKSQTHPSYIRRMQDLFDSQFQEAYTLDSLAERLGVNKYRLCREFKAAYQISPLQYLNRQRIRHAASLLLATDCKIYEVGNMVGIENTNHFICLFKKYYGSTPLEYKERMVP